jgi:hypothetical protein
VLGHKLISLSIKIANISAPSPQDLFEGLVPHLVEGGLSFLQYADDTIIFLDDDIVRPGI